MTTLLGILLSVQVSGPIVQVDTMAELRQALRSANAGTTIEMAPGKYEGSVFASDLHGTAERPIVIRGRKNGEPPLLTGATGLHLSKVSHIVLQNLRVRDCAANGINIDDEGDASKPSHHVTISNVHVANLPKGNHDGIKLSGVRDFVVKNVEIENWGGSAIDMVGCHNGKILSSRFQNGGDNAVQTKGGTSRIVVENCRFIDYGQRGVNIGGSTGFEFFRPPLSEMPANARYEARDITVQGCTFIRGVAPVAFVGVDGARVAYNTIYHPGKWAVRILQETRDPSFVPSRRGGFERNLVYFSSDRWGEGGVNIGPGTEPESFAFRDNFWFCFDRPAASRPKLPVQEAGGVYGIDPMWIVSGQPRLREGSPAAAYGAEAFKSGG